MAEEDKYKTAFITPDGLFEFNVMAFGQKNAPSHFVKQMNMVCAGLNWFSVLVYLDDILCFSSSVEQHLKDLDALLERL